MEITSFAYLINSSLFHYSAIHHCTGTFFSKPIFQIWVLARLICSFKNEFFMVLRVICTDYN